MFEFLFLFETKLTKTQLFIIMDQITLNRNVLKKLKEPINTTYAQDLKLIINTYK